MAGPFTLPDPLRADANPKTLSIYVTELQDCVNEKRQEIAQVPLTFIVQTVGKIMSLDAIEELKTRVNTLAIDFGFIGGITNVNLLGRPYVDHPKIIGVPVTGFPIINDLRRVLELLVRQQRFEIGMILQNYYILEGEPVVESDNLFSFKLNSDTRLHWKDDPLFAQGISGGTDCEDGPPICDNNLPGLFDDNVVTVSDVHILFIESIVSGVLQWNVGPLGGPYILAPISNIGSIWADGTLFSIFDPAITQNFDETYYYLFDIAHTVGGIGVDVYRKFRDGSEPWELVHSFDNAYKAKFGFNSIAMGRDSIFVRSSSVDKLAIIDKNSFAVTEVDLDFINLNLRDTQANPEPGAFITTDFGDMFYRDGGVDFTYIEKVRFTGATVNNVFIPPHTYQASGIGRISEGQSTFVVSDVRLVSKIDINLLNANLWTTFGNPGTNFDIQGVMEDGIWSNVNSQTQVLPSGQFTPPPPGGFAFEGAVINTGPIFDYKGDRVVFNFNTPGASVLLTKSSEMYVSKNGTTPIIINDIVPQIVSARINVGAVDNVTIGIDNHKSGTIRYEFQRRTMNPIGSWVTQATVNSLTDPVQAIITLAIGVDYQVRINLLTEQGIIEATIPINIPAI